MTVTLETLLQDAENLLAEHPDERPPRPDFSLPSDYEEGTPYALMKLTENGLKGRGWFAQEDIPAGTVLVCEKPIVMVMDWQDPQDGDGVDAEQQDEQLFEQEEDDEAMEENEVGMSKLNELLLLELLKKIAQDPSIWTDKLSQLFPRTYDDLEVLKEWVCKDDAMFVLIEEHTKKLKDTMLFSEEDLTQISKRLPLVVKYNVLSAETCPELMVHPAASPQGYAALSGTGLYYLPSFFNHDCQPNASRYSIGDICWIVSNQDINHGDEICISYLEHDVLCEPAAVRTIMLDMDFAEPEQEGSEEVDEEAPDMPVVDIDVQNELMQMDPMERLFTIDKLIQQALGEAGPDDEDGNEEEEQQQDSPPWFECDVQNLRILKALTLDSLGRVQEALLFWQECVVFCETKLPPNDESLVVMSVQAALCAMQCSLDDVAKEYAKKALETHKVLFGGGVKRFRRRYQREFQLALRPSFSNGGPEDLWPIVINED